MSVFVANYMSVFVANQDSLTFHIRVTKKCNADCSYCSSYEQHTSDLMSISDLEKSLSYISSLILKFGLGGKRKMITVQYVGGEISTVPVDYLNEFTNLVQDKLSPYFQEFRHGVQSNLIASKARLNHLLDIFDSNIGTSLDTHTKQRTVGKSSERYQKIFFDNLNYTRKHIGKNPAAIIVIDEKMSPHIEEEILFSEKNNINLTLRPVFSGGKEISIMNVSALTELYNHLFDQWFMNSNISIEPFASLLNKRFLKYKNDYLSLSSYSGCPFQNNCATSSINMEPDGSLYVCLDMADSKHYPFGNALNGEIDENIFNMLQTRTEKLNTDCIRCDYFNECQGGCMNEAIEHTGEVFGKTLYCSTWKNLFKRIDDGISQHGLKNVEAWINKIS